MTIAHGASNKPILRLLTEFSFSNLIQTFLIAIAWLFRWPKTNLSTFIPLFGEVPPKLGFRDSL